MNMEKFTKGPNVELTGAPALTSGEPEPVCGASG
jgi:hypothetical protein